MPGAQNNRVRDVPPPRRKKRRLGERSERTAAAAGGHGPRPGPLLSLEAFNRSMAPAKQSERMRAVVCERSEP